jgi:hypothetical protein
MNLYAERLKHTMNLDRRVRRVRRLWWGLCEDLAELLLTLRGWFK